MNKITRICVIVASVALLAALMAIACFAEDVQSETWCNPISCYPNGAYNSDGTTNTPGYGANVFGGVIDFSGESLTVSPSVSSTDKHGIDYCFTISGLTVGHSYVFGFVFDYSNVYSIYYRVNGGISIDNVPTSGTLGTNRTFRLITNLPVLDYTITGTGDTFYSVSITNVQYSSVDIYIRIADENDQQTKNFWKNLWDNFRNLVDLSGLQNYISIFLNKCSQFFLFFGEIFQTEAVTKIMQVSVGALCFAILIKVGIS